MTISTLVKQTRTTLESAKSDIDLALRQCTTSRALRQRRLCAAAQAGRAYVFAVEGGMNLPAQEMLAIISTQRPLTDDDALGVWYCCFAAGVRGKYPERLKGSSRRQDSTREKRNEAGEVMGRDGKPLKWVKTKHKGPDGKTYLGEMPSGPFATEGDTMDETRLLDEEQQVSGNWSDLIALLIESLDAQSRAEREDDPDEDEIAMARQVCRANPRIKRDQLKSQLEVGSTKATILLDRMRDEGIATSKKRNSPRKTD